MQLVTPAGAEDEAFALSNKSINEKETITMRSLITLTLSLGLLTACGDKETEDTALEEAEEVETTEEESEDTSASEEEETTEETTEEEA